MVSILLNRWSWLLVVLGGISYIALNAIIEIFFPDHWSGSDTTLIGMSYTDFSRLLWVPMALLLAGLIGVYKHLSEPLGRLGRSGHLLASVGLILAIFGNIIEFWVCGRLLVPLLGPFRTGGDCSNFGYSISGYGTIFLMVGLLLLGVAGLRSNLSTRWRVALFTTGLIYVSALLFYIIEPQLLVIHAILFGTAWIFIGYLLREDKLRGTPAEP